MTPTLQLLLAGLTLLMLAMVSYSMLLDLTEETLGNYRIYPSRSQDHKKNPLSADQKVGHMRKMFPHHKDKIQNNEAHRNIFDILRDLNDEGHKHVTMVVGDDRVKEFDSLTKKYNGVHYDFNTINIKSAGARDPKSEDPIEKLSASSMRKHASSDDHDSFHAGMPKGISRKHSQQMMADSEDRNDTPS